MYVNRKCTAKLQEKNLASKTSEYERIKRIDEETGEPVYITEEELDIRFKKKSPEEKQREKEEKKKLKEKRHMLQYPAQVADDPETKSSKTATEKSETRSGKTATEKSETRSGKTTTGKSEAKSGKTTTENPETKSGKTANKR
jgi:hypothetical protein